MATIYIKIHPQINNRPATLHIADTLLKRQDEKKGKGQKNNQRRDY